MRTHAIRIVVEQYRQVGDAVDGQRMQCIFALGRQRVRRRSHQQCIGTDFNRGLCVLDRFLGPQRTGSDDVAAALLDTTFNKLHQLKTFRHRLRIVFAGSAGRDNAVHSGVDQKFHDFGEALIVDTVIIPVRRYHRGINAFKFHRWNPAITNSPPPC